MMGGALRLAAALSVSTSVALAIAWSISGCSWLSTQEAKTVEHGALRTADVLCILANSLLDSPQIAEACSIEKALLPEIEKLLAAHKAAARREAVASAARDAGVKDAAHE